MDTVINSISNAEILKKDRNRFSWLKWKIFDMRTSVLEDLSGEFLNIWDYNFT